jgi:hypothetical protein
MNFIFLSTIRVALLSSLLLLASCGGSSDAPATDAPPTDTPPTDTPPTDTPPTGAPITVGGYVLKSSHSLPVDRILPATAETSVNYTVPDASTGLTTLSAPAGTFEANATLFVINVSVQRKHEFTAAADGSLSDNLIFAPYGSELLIRVKHSMGAGNFSALSSAESNYLQVMFAFDRSTLSDDESMRTVTGFRLKIMPSAMSAGDFYGVSLMHDDFGNAIPRAISGTIAATSGLSSTSTPALSLDMRLYGTGTVTDPRAEMRLKPSHDAAGAPLGTNSRFITTKTDAVGNSLSTATDNRNTLIESIALSVPTSDANGMDYSLSDVLDFSQYNPNNNSHALVDGHYMLTFNLGLADSTLEATTITGTQTLVEESDNNTMLLPISIGTVDPAKEPLVFFLDANPDGYVGIYDQTTFEDFGINYMTHLATKGVQVLTRYRPDGRLKQYNFAPFIPRMSVADRRTPSVNLMAIDALKSELSIVLTTPSLTTINLPSVFGSYLRNVHNKNINLQSRSAGGVHMTDVLQMVLNDSAGDYIRSFSESGEYSMAVMGTLVTLEGKSIRVDQNMSFLVADYLVTAHYSTLPMMPLQSGDFIRPMVTLMPAIPASVDINITYAPNSTSPTVTRFTGTANHSGVFVASTEMDFAQAGEYRVDIQVNHTDSNGHYYAGSRSFASVVADTAPSVTAHGKRGIDNMADLSIDANRWFSRDGLGTSDNYVVGTAHVLAPYEHGDVEWVEEDVAGVVRASLAYNATLDGASASCELAELSAWSTTSELDISDCVNRTFGRPIINATPDTGFTAHSYNAVERFSIRVRESIGDNNAHGYWRFNDEYGHQRGVGTIGDKPDELKFQYIGTVVKDHVNTMNHYSSQATLFVLTAADGRAATDTRVFPPFNGHGIQPGGGPIIKLGARDVEAFVWPTTLVPGSTITEGDVVPFYGQIAPTLPLKIDLTITKPDLTTSTVTATANKNGFVRSSDITFDQAGLYTIKPTLTYASGESTSAGGLTSDIVVTDALLGVNNSYHLYVSPVVRQQLPMNITLSNNPATPETLDLASNPVFRVMSDSTTSALTNVTLHVTAFMDGWIIDQATSSGSSIADVSYQLDLSTLEQTFNTIDVGDGETSRSNTYTDLIRVSFMLQGVDENSTTQTFVRTFTLDGENVLSN